MFVLVLFLPSRSNVFLNVMYNTLHTQKNKSTVSFYVGLIVKNVKIHNPLRLADIFDPSCGCYAAFAESGKLEYRTRIVPVSTSNECKQ